jgi:hypothetical protein
MPVSIVIIIVAAAALFVLALRFLRGKPAPSVPTAESILLEEAVIVEPVAPGMEGKAEISKPGSPVISLRVRATDASEVFARGAKVRIIDLHEGLCIIEGADKEHLAR